MNEKEYLTAYKVIRSLPLNGPSGEAIMKVRDILANEIVSNMLYDGSKQEPETSKSIPIYS